MDQQRQGFIPRVLTVALLFAVAVFPDFLGLRVGYPFGVYPQLDFSGSQVELGLSVNFSKNVSAFVVRNQPPNIPYFIGLTFH